MRAPRSSRKSRGMATVLLVLAIAAFFTAFMLYNALGSVAKREDAGTNNQQSFAKLDDAILRFAMTNKRLPCPAIGTQRTGLADPNSATTTCNTPAGIVPWATLGLSETDALDSWSRYISYRVFDGATGFTSSTGFDTSNCQGEATLTSYATGSCPATHENTISDFISGRGLTVNDLGTAKTGVAYVLISHGETGNGSYYPGATAPNTMPSSASKEFLNAGSAGTYWIVSASSPDVGADSASHFDDFVRYADAATLARATKLPRAWPLGVALNATTVPASTGYSTAVSSLKVTSTSPAGASLVTASADNARQICQVKTGPSTIIGISPCDNSSGNDEFKTDNNEKLTFDFKVKRTQLILKLTDFQVGANAERAQVTFYNGATQVQQNTLTACTLAGLTDTSQYKIAMPAGTEFTKVDVAAINKTTGGSSSDFAAAEIGACHSSSIAPCTLSTDSYGYCP